MLVLTREPGEIITIGDNITITVIEVTEKFSRIPIRECQVRVGIEAPKEVEVHRLEIYAKNILEKQRKKEDELKK